MPFIEERTEQVVEALRTVTISVPSVVPLNDSRGASQPLAISLDESATEQQAPGRAAAAAAATVQRQQSAAYQRRQALVRRDSLKRREALLKGKEGSRRRQRWENDRLLNNPYAQPPLPSDWEIRPTYPRHSTVPYFLAPLWDEKMSREAGLDDKARGQRHANHTGETTKVPKELRARLKRAKAAMGLLRDLEGEIRKFVQTWEQQQQRKSRTETDELFDSEDEEIVFVGRNGQMSDMVNPRIRSSKDRLELDKMIFHSSVDDHGAAFGRWLVHSIAGYYGLRTWSVTVGDPARREAYVGIHPVKTGLGSKRPVRAELPRPLWALV